MVKTYKKILKNIKIFQQTYSFPKYEIEKISILFSLEIN